MLKIFIAHRDSFGEGRIIGRWIDLPTGRTDVELLQDMEIGGTWLDDYFIYDYKTDIEGLKIGKDEDFFALNSAAEEYDDLSEWEQKTVQAIIEAETGDLAQAIKNMEEGDYNLYEVDSFEELAEQFVGEGLFGDIPDSIINYIDYEAIGRDLSLDDFTETSVGILEHR